MNFVNRYFPLIGRILLSSIFLSSGMNKIFSWDQTAHYMTSKGFPLVSLFLFGAIALEVFGGLSVLLGFKAKLGAVLLILFIIPATIIFHNFWIYEGIEQQGQIIMFMKNLAIMGGLFGLISNGSGPFSLDNIVKH